jgi:endothelin-converting enzyme/putative endopeptidase
MCRPGSPRAVGQQSIVRYICASLTALTLAVGLLHAQTPAPNGVETASLDRRADPCIDFYQFACGGWVAKNPVPADRRTWGRFAEVQDRNQQILKRILEAPSADRDTEKAQAYYAACMDEGAIDARGLAPVRPELARIDAIASRAQLPALVAHLHTIAGEGAAVGGAVRRGGAYVLFAFGPRPRFDDASQQMANVAPDGIALPTRDYYVKTDDRSVKLRDEYRAHVAEILQLAGAPAADAERGAAAVLAIETKLATAMLDVAARRDPNAQKHPMRLADLQQLSLGFDWTAYLHAVSAPTFDEVNIAEPAFVRAMSDVVTATSLDDLKAYFRWHLLNGSAQMLPKRFADAHFAFFSRTLVGQQAQAPRWRECIIDVDQQLGEALGKAFVEQAFGPRAKADMLAMVQGIKEAMRRDIDASPWMSTETKAAAKTKLDAVVDRIGYPDRWRDYSAVRVSRDTALENRQHTTAFLNERRIQQIGKPADKNDWRMTPPTVNAYYSPPNNNINFPAGILQPPFYDPSRDAAVNYGGVGAVIGHELTHGFDDQGRKYDGQGNLRDWWTPADGKAFEERATCVADQYSEYVVAGDTHINGRLTLGENTADNGGLRLALMAYLAGPAATAVNDLDGFTPEQRVFLGWAQVWCEDSRPEFERLIATTNPHAANRYRVNGPLSNMPEFQKAFACKADSPMVRANACRVW